MKYLAILQARNNSSRFPKKIMSKVNNISILSYCIKRIQDSNKINRLIIATTTNKTDDPIISLAKKLNIDCFRGSENDVLGRFYSASCLYNTKNIVRLNSDNPLIDPKIIDNAINQFESKKLIDYASTILSETFPLGMHVEILTKRVLKNLNDNVKNIEYREHVTPYIYKNPKKYNILSIFNTRNLSNYRLTIDYPEDLLVFKKIINLYKGDLKDLTLDKTIDILDKNPDIKKINSYLLRKQSI